MSISEKLTQIAENEPKVYDAGYVKGYTEGETKGFESGKSEGIEEGYVEGKADGITEGIEQGRKAEYNAFWGNTQQNGTRDNYLGAFSGTGWTPLTFLPPFPIYDENGKLNLTNAFSHHNAGQTPYDFVEHCEKNNIVIDFSKVSYFTSCFSYAQITTLGVIDFKSVIEANGSYSWSSAFIGMPIKSIAKLVFYETNPEFNTGMFQNCSKLMEITVEGIIAKTGLNFQWSPLTPASMKSVILHLKNYKGTDNEGKCTIKFSDACWTALETDSTAPDGGTWKNYVVEVLGWKY